MDSARTLSGLAESWCLQGRIKSDSLCASVTKFQGAWLWELFRRGLGGPADRSPDFRYGAHSDTRGQREREDASGPLVDM